MKFRTILIMLFLAVNIAARAQIPDCPGAPPSRLIVGERARVLPGEPNNVRFEPSLNGRILSSIPAGGVFTVLEGPVCADNYAWWRVDYQGNRGWTAEGEDQTYFLEPLIPITIDNTARVGQFQRLGRGVFTTGVKWSPDGKQLIVGSTIGAWTFNVEDWASPPSGPFGTILPAPISAVAYSRNEQNRLAVAHCHSYDAQQLCTQTEIRTYQTNPYQEHWYAYDGQISAVEFVGADERLVIAAGNQVVLLEAGLGSKDVLWTGEKPIRSLAISADGRILVATDGKTVVVGRPIRPAQPLTHWDFGASEVTAVALSPDGALLAISHPQQITLWEVQKGTRLGSVENQGWVSAPDCQPGCPKTGSPATTRAMQFTPDGKNLISANDSGSLTVFSVSLTRATPLQQERLIDPGVYLPLTSLALSPDSSRVAFNSMTSNASNTLYIWDYQTGQAVAVVSEGHTQPVVAAAFRPDSLGLVSFGSDGTLRLWDTISGKQTARFNAGGSTGQALAFSPDGRLIATLSLDYGDTGSGMVLRLQEAASGKLQAEVRGQNALGASSVAISPDGQWLASDVPLPAYNNVPHVGVWRVADMLQSGDKTLPQLSIAAPGGMTSLAFSPDSQTLAIAESSGAITLHNITDGARVQTLAGQTSPIRQLTFNPNGKQLASSSGDNMAWVWDLAAGTQELVLTNAGDTTGLAFNPDGTLLAVSTNAGVLQFWNAATGEYLGRITTTIGGFTSLAFSSDGVFLAAGSDTLVMVYRILSPHSFGIG